MNHDPSASKPIPPTEPGAATGSPGAPAGESTDVVVIGGGPAGSTASAVLAEGGLRVILLEREGFPRFHIGESLMTETYWALERVGVLERMKNSPFVRKYSVQFISESGRTSRPFYFFEHNPHESGVTWQVERAEFDSLLLDNAREKGAEARIGWNVERVLFEGERAVGVRGARPGGERFEIRARVVVDATGLHSLLSRQLGIKKKDPKLDKAAVYAHFENARRDPGIDEGATLVVHTRGNRGWFWYIPLHRNRVSVGVVGLPQEIIKGKGKPEEVLEREIAACPAIAERVRDARRIPPVRVTSDYTWRSTSCAGEGFVLIGDAFGFIDPIYSTGVHLALKAGVLAGETILAAFKDGDFSGARLGAFGQPLAEGMEALRKLVYAFYTPGFSFANFVNQHPEHRPQLIRLLMGDVFGDPVKGLFEAMSAMCEFPEPLPLEPAGPIPAAREGARTG
jgi:flavin-dependent dehydrogenase